MEGIPETSFFLVFACCSRLWRSVIEIWDREREACWSWSMLHSTKQISSPQKTTKKFLNWKFWLCSFLIFFASNRLKWKTFLFFFLYLKKHRSNQKSSCFPCYLILVLLEFLFWINKLVFLISVSSFAPTYVVSCVVAEANELIYICWQKQKSFF